jgi:hypothetical protein
MKLIKTLIFFIACSYTVAAQSDFGTWFVYKNNTKLSDKFTFNGNIQYRSFEMDFEDDHFVAINGFSYSASSNVTISAGHRYLHAKSNFLEHGMYQGLSIKSKLNSVKINNRFMVEERWINNNLQLRYRVGVDFGFPLSEKVELVLSEEAFLMNQGNNFNQNRITVKTNFSLSDAFKLSTGLMHWQFSNFHRWVAQVVLVHNLDFRKK